MKSSPYNIDIILPLRLHFLEIVNVPIPLLNVGVKLPLNDNVCPLLIVTVFIVFDKVFHSPLSTQYSHALTDNLAVKPSSNASIAK